MRLSTLSLLQQSYGTALSSKKGLQEVLFPTHPLIQNNVYPIDQLVGNVQSLFTAGINPFFNAARNLVDPLQ